MQRPYYCAIPAAHLLQVAPRVCNTLQPLQLARLPAAQGRLHGPITGVELFSETRATVRVSLSILPAHS